MISANLFDLKTQAFLTSIRTRPSDNQSMVPQPIMRHKRQVKLEEKRVNQTVTQNFHPIATFNKKEGILANGYQRMLSNATVQNKPKQKPLAKSQTDNWLQTNFFSKLGIFFLQLKVLTKKKLFLT